MVEWATAYCEHFHAVVPVGCWTFTSNGKEVDLWKSVLIKNWTQEPLRTKAEIQKTWGKYGFYGHQPNIGIVTGQICGGYIVIDLDNKPEKGVNGWEELKSWEHQTGMKLPEDTWTAITGGGGYHLWFKTDKAMRSYVNESVGIDLRADGAQVIVPPSIHISGRRYEWEIGPNECECAEANEAVYQFIEDYRPAGSQYQQSTQRGSGGEREMVLPPEIKEGGRHTPLISIIGTLNRLGVSDESIEYVIRTENALKCKPPFTEEELQKEIFPAIYRWEKGVSAEQWKNREDFLKDLKAAAARERRMKAAMEM